MGIPLKEEVRIFVFGKLSKCLLWKVRVRLGGTGKKVCHFPQMGPSLRRVGKNITNMCPPLVKACFSFSEVFSWEQSGNIAAARIWGVVYVALGTNRCCQIWHLDPNRVCTYINRELLSVFDYLQFVRFRRGLVTTVSPSPLDFLGCGFADDDDESLCGRHVCVCVCGKLCNRFRCHWRQVLPQKEIREKTEKKGKQSHVCQALETTSFPWQIPFKVPQTFCLMMSSGAKRKPPKKNDIDCGKGHWVTISIPDPRPGR